ncbi:MAG: winged helix-turn-helix domain-containing protein [Anaerolineae bacterium]|nr:MAG: winged helix-turn-helix domain-containing protein [Anaerolineae bacterium]
MQTLSQAAVRGLMIAAQGLDDTPQPPATKNAVRSTLRQIHMLQLDSINVVARSPYFVLWSRLGDYNPLWLDELLEEGALFEYWSNANCLLPIEDYAWYRAGSRIIEEKRLAKWREEHPSLAERVMNHVRTYGDTRAADFESTDGKKGGWSDPKDEQIALEYLYFLGELMVRKRHNFQRVYDLRERVYPDGDKLPSVAFTDAHDQFVLYTLQALGVTKAEWIADYFRLRNKWVKASLQRLEKQNAVMTVAVEGWDTPGYLHPDTLQQVEAAAAGHIPQSKTTLLSPFDPLVWDRGRVRDLFGMEYKNEFFMPAAKRQYGYFSVPILYHNALIGRLDPKAHRQEGVFEVKALHLEPGVVVDDELVVALKATLQACARWHKTPQVIVRESAEPSLAKRLSD